MEKALSLTLAVTISLIYGSRFVAQAQQSPPPKGQISAAEILDKHVAATGGSEALRALQTVYAYGSFGLPLLNTLGDFHFYYKAPDSDALQFDEVSHGQASVGHKEGVPFSAETVKSFVGLNGVTLNILEEGWLALIESRFDRDYTRIEFVGLTTVDNRWVYALRFTPKSGDPQVRYYDYENFRMARMDMVQRIRLQKDGPETAYKVETYFSEYRDSGGTYFPRKIRATASNGNIVLDIHEVRANAPVKDSVFRNN